MAHVGLQSNAVFDRMEAAVQLVRARLVRATAALRAGNVPYAVIGGHAVAAWVATVDVEAVRNTKDVDLLVERADLPRCIQALAQAGFVHRHAAGLDVFLDGSTGSPRSGVHLAFANETVRPGEPLPNPAVEDARDFGDIRVLELRALVQIKLTAFRDKDRTHLRDLLDVGLVDAGWVATLPPPLGARLQSLIETPNG